jgi:endonuclease-3
VALQFGRRSTEKQAPLCERRSGCDIFFGLMAKTKKKSENQRAARAVKSAARPAKTAGSRAVAGRTRKSTGGLAVGRGANPARVRAILQGLDEAYPEASCELIHDNPFELLISTILSAQCTDVRVNMVTKDLFQKYPDAKALAYADPRALEQEIRPTGFFRNKTKSIMGASKKIVEEFGGKVPQTMQELLALPGVARKTANVVLGSGFGIASGVVVDTHVQRLSERLDLTKNTDPKKIEQDLMQIIPREKWILFSHQLIWHGRRVCNARKPKCVECNLEPLCYSKDKTN